MLKNGSGIFNNYDKCAVSTEFDNKFHFDPNLHDTKLHIIKLTIKHFFKNNYSVHLRSLKISTYQLASGQFRTFLF